MRMALRGAGWVCVFIYLLFFMTSYHSCSKSKTIGDTLEFSNLALKTSLNASCFQINFYKFSPFPPTNQWKRQFLFKGILVTSSNSALVTLSWLAEHAVLLPEVSCLLLEPGSLQPRSHSQTHRWRRPRRVNLLPFHIS